MDIGEDSWGAYFAHWDLYDGDELTLDAHEDDDGPYLALCQGDQASGTVVVRLRPDQAFEVGECLMSWAKTGRFMEESTPAAEPESICESLLERWKREKKHYSPEEQELIDEICQLEVDYVTGKENS